MDSVTPPRRLTWALATTLAVAGLGCESCGSSTPRATVSEQAPRAEEPVLEPDLTPPSEPPPAELPPDEPQPPSEPAPLLTLDTRWEGGRASVSVANRTPEPVRFASRLVLERVNGDTGTPLADRGELRAHLDADRPLPDCAELAPGAHLELTFDGLRGPGCSACDAPSPGTYRFVVTSCDGRSRTDGPSFEVR